MILAAAALAASISTAAVAAKPYQLGAHWQYWGPNVTRKAISIGIPRKDEHVMLYFPYGDCRQMRVFSGHYGDLDKAREFLWKSKLCQKASVRGVAWKAN